MLFGSRARGDARPDSDYDIGLFLTELHSFDRESQALAEIETDILMATGAVVNALPLPACSYAERTTWMQAVRRDGVALEVEAYLNKAAEDLADARKFMTIPLPQAAARSAYYWGFSRSKLAPRLSDFFHSTG